MKYPRGLPRGLGFKGLGVKGLGSWVWLSHEFRVAGRNILRVQVAK